MKKTVCFLLAAITFVAIFLSCNKKDDNPAKALAGSWEYEKTVPDVQTNNEAATAHIRKKLEKETQELVPSSLMLIAFDGVKEYSNFFNRGTYTVNGSTLTLTDERGVLIHTFAFNVENNYLILSENCELYIKALLMDFPESQSVVLQRTNMVYYYKKK